jgi:hypothetical protein
MTRSRDGRGPLRGGPRGRGPLAAPLAGEVPG